MRFNYLTFGITAIVVFTVYLFTSAPGLGLVDSGELTTAAATLSIAHPTGYPLYVMLGHLWLSIGWLGIARGMIIFSVLCGALASGVLALLAERMLQSVRWLSDSFRIVISILAAIGFAVSTSAWTSVSFAEVYPLTWLMTAILLWLAAHFERADSDQKTALPFLASYLFGLGFGNHFTNLWFAPLMIWVVVRYLKHNPSRVKAFVQFAALFLLGFSVNLFLPIRSALNPLLDWSHPADFSGLIRHLTAWQYRVWMFEGGFSGLIGKLGGYFAGLPKDLGWGLTIAAMLGILSLFKRRSPFVIAALLVWIVGVTYNLNYDIPDISTYFISLYGAFFVLAVAGVIQLAQFIANLSASVRARSVSMMAIAITLPLLSIWEAGKDCLQSSNTFARDYTVEIMRTLPDSALVMQGNWDIQSPFIYLQNIEHKRPDLAMLDLNLMQRPWYIRQQRRAYPYIFAGSESLCDAFIREVAPFEAGKPFDGQRIEAAFVAMINSIITRNLNHRPVYVRDTGESGHPGISAKMPRLPGAYFIRLAQLPDSEPIIQADSLMRGLTAIGEREKYLLNAACLSAAAQSRLALTVGDTTFALSALQQALKLNPANPDVHRIWNDLRQKSGTAQSQ